MNKETKEAINGYINGIKNGDRECLELLHKEISPSLRHIALKYLKNNNDADDLVQDFWADIYKISLGFVFNRNGFNYLCKVMTNRAINRYRKIYHTKCSKVSYVDYEALHEKAEQQEIKRYNSNVTLDELVEQNEQAIRNRIIDRAINGLPELQRIIVQLIFFEEKTVREIAKQLNISKSLVSKLKKVAIEKLKEELSSLIVDKNNG